MIREGIHETADKAQINSFEAFEGRYHNLPDTFEIEEFRGRTFYGKENYYLWNVFSTHKGKVDHQKWGQCSVQIDFLTDKKAEISLIYEDSIIQSRKIRGKFENGYFHKRPAFLIIPLFPLAFGYNTDATDLDSVKMTI